MSEPTTGDAFRILEYIAAEWRPEIRPINLKALLYLCEGIAADRPGHLRCRIEALLAHPGLAHVLAEPPRAYDRDEYVEAVNGEWG